MSDIQRPMLDLTGKVAFVAGAGSVGDGWGNGRATAMLMARQGARIFGVDVSARAIDGTRAALEREGLTNWDQAICDMTDSAQVRAAVDQCLARFGRIDILVNNVGGSAPGDPVSMPEHVWDTQIDHNLKTVFLGCKHVLPVMQRQFEAEGRGGAVVNISSIAYSSFEVGRVNVAYAAAKAGVVAFAGSTAMAYVQQGIRVNTVVVGLVHTPLVEHRLMQQLQQPDLESLIARRNASVPMGRMGDAWDVAHAVLFLASDEAKYITGTHLVVDGGVTVARPDSADRGTTA